jgi:hypothetical protein
VLTIAFGFESWWSIIKEPGDLIKDEDGEVLLVCDKTTLF